MFSYDPLNDDGQASAPRQAERHASDLLIPVEVDSRNFITSFVVVDDRGFPEGGQNTLFDYVGNSFRESKMSLTIHRELNNPTLEDGYAVTLLNVARSIDQCSTYTHHHATRTAFWASQIAIRMGFPDEDIDRLALASQLHDIGKVVVPKPVLTKPGELSDQEWQIMRRHPTFGAKIMEPSPRLRPLIPMVRAHHERVDGSGYPEGLKGNQIPIEARIISAADAFTTITEGRVYRSPSTCSAALCELKRWSGKQFDPGVVDAMVAIIAEGGVNDGFNGTVGS